MFHLLQFFFSFFFFNLFLERFYALDNGVALTPPLGWSTWNTFRFHINEDLIKGSTDIMVSSGLKAAGYEYILIDDGWTTCLTFNSDGSCILPGPRDSQNRIQVNATKFPSGFKSLTNYVHSKGLKIGIYTAVSKRTCGGFVGSLGYEKIDAQSFADWGFDFVKHDTCNHDCGVIDGCMQRSTGAMRDGLNATGRPMVYYIDAGNPTSPQRLYNPKHHHVPAHRTIKVANDWRDLVWVWGNNTANMWKSWFDIADNWFSLLDNVHHQISLAMYQQKGAYNTPDMVTIGQGAMTQGQYRAAMFLWSVLGAPIILGNDIRKMDAFTLSLVTAPEVLAVDQDADCVQGSLLDSLDSGEIWGKPLGDGSFAIVILNKDQVQAKNFTVWMSTGGDLTDSVSQSCDGSCNGGLFYPAPFSRATVRDIYLRKDLGAFQDYFTAVVDPMDARIFKFVPLS